MDVVLHISVYAALLFSCSRAKIGDSLGFIEYCNHSIEIDDAYLRALEPRECCKSVATSGQASRKRHQAAFLFFHTVPCQDVSWV